VLLIATIEHVADPAGLLEAVARVLKPGGRLMLVTDNTDTLDFRLARKRVWGGYHFPRHWNLFNRASLNLLAARSGLTVTAMDSVISPVNWVYSIRNKLVDSKAPRLLIEQFSLKAPLALAFFTALDLLFHLLGRGALIRMIAQKPK
jgi:SAM-dependent methyltransferase